jgi:hypothetical protein
MFGWLRRRTRKGPNPIVSPPPAVGSLVAQPSYWIQIQGSELAQGDYLPGCLVPEFQPDFGTLKPEEVVSVAKADLIVTTQSCDLENRRAAFVALCPIHSLDSFEEFNPQFRRRGEWEQVRKGRHEGLHLLASPTSPENNREALVVDFRQIFSLPFGYLIRHAASLGPRWRLQSPFLEHFSQSFARFFMRVGLPSAIPPFK